MQSEFWQVLFGGHRSLRGNMGILVILIISIHKISFLFICSFITTQQFFLYIFYLIDHFIPIYWFLSMFLLSKIDSSLLQYILTTVSPSSTVPSFPPISSSPISTLSPILFRKEEASKRQQAYRKKQDKQDKAKALIMMLDKATQLFSNVLVYRIQMVGLLLCAGM